MIQIVIPDQADQPQRAAKLFTIAVKRFVALPDAVKRLVQPYLARQKNAILDPFQGHKHLVEPVLRRRNRVLIVPRVCGEADVAEKVLTVFHPFTDRNAMFVKDRSGRRQEGSSAGTLISLDTTCSMPTLFEEKGLAPTVRASHRNEGVDHFRFAAVCYNTMTFLIVGKMMLLQECLHRGQLFLAVPWRCLTRIELRAAAHNDHPCYIAACIL